MKKRVRFGSGREMKKLISQHDPPLPRFFTPLPLSRCSIWHCVLPTERPEHPRLILPHSHAPFSLITVCPKEAIPLSGSGKISSTNYPKNNYTASRNCTWNITAPADKIVKFTFIDFVLSECSANHCSDSCSYVELYDGGSTSSPLLGRFCQGSSWNETQLSSGNQMFVMFHPGKAVARGFEAKYESTTTGGEYPLKFILNIVFYNLQIFLLREFGLDALRNRLCTNFQLISHFYIFKRQTDFRHSPRSR